LQALQGGEVSEEMRAVLLADAAGRLDPTCGRQRRRVMSKGQKRSNREQKKPKQDKPKVAVAQSALAALHERPTLPTPAKRK
jgi:hypothetical protein